MPETSAYHEAGHALLAVYVGARVNSVTIDPDRDDGPQRYADAQVEWPTGELTGRELHERIILVALAGPVAEMIYTGNPYHPGLVAEWAVDWQLALKSAGQLFPTEQKQMAYLEQATVQLYRLLDRDDYWAALAAVADELLAHETLEGDDVEDIVGQWLPGG